MTGGNCGIALPAQTDIILGAAPYSITATELNQSGYTYSICYSCEITGFPAIFFTKDLTITGSPLDCSTCLVDAAFVSPAAIPYNSAGSSVAVVNGYTDIFTHT